MAVEPGRIQIKYAPGSTNVTVSHLLGSVATGAHTPATTATPVALPVTPARPGLNETAPPFVPARHSGTQSAQFLAEASTRPCRNIAIYGFCKNKNKGCAFNHDGERPSAQPATAVPPFNPAAYATNQSSGFIAAQQLPFVSYATTYYDHLLVDPAASEPITSSADIAQEFQDGNAYSAHYKNGENYNASSGNNDDEQSGKDDDDIMVRFEDATFGTGGEDGIGLSEQFVTDRELASASYFPIVMPNTCVTTEAPELCRHLYFPLSSPSGNHISSGASGKVHLGHYFVDDELRADLARRSAAAAAATQAILPLATELFPRSKSAVASGFESSTSVASAKASSLTSATTTAAAAAVASAAIPKSLPNLVHHYHSLVALETPNEMPSRTLGHRSMWYRGTSQRDGMQYALLQLLDYKLIGEHLLASVVDAWSRIRHPGLVPLHEAFTSSAFDDGPSLVLSYEYYPGAYALSTRPIFLVKDAEQVQLTWSYLLQLVAVLDKLHREGLTVQNLDSSKFLVTASGRLRINAPGALEFVLGRPLAVDKRGDYFALGKAMLAMLTPQSTTGGSYGPFAVQASFTPTVSTTFTTSALKFVGSASTGASASASAGGGRVAISNAGPSAQMDRVRAQLEGWPKALVEAVVYLLDTTTEKSTRALLQILDDQVIVPELDALRTRADYLEDQLLRSLENGRIARLTMKLQFINERPEHRTDPRWQETGERYLVKLFRDYVFHTVDLCGNPVVDVGHVVSCLNKLDAGSSERIMLTSNDGRNCLIVGYDEVKRCVDSAFAELTAHANPEPGSTVYNDTGNRHRSSY